MKIKSYFASSVEQAIQEARQELGTDAMLITSRRSSPETRHLGAYEVVFGLQAPESAPSLVPAADVSAPSCKTARATAGNQEHVARRAEQAEVPLVGSRGAIRGAGCKRSGRKLRRKSVATAFQVCAANFPRSAGAPIALRGLPRSSFARSFDLRGRSVARIRTPAIPP